MITLKRLRLLLVCMIAVMAGCAATDPATERTAEQQIDDTVTLSRVKTALLASDETDGADIDVDVYRGRVTLSGVVRSPSSRQAAIRIAEEVRGVDAVEDNLRLTPRPPAPP
ncbi:MAG: BON domain-containing protein [Pseudomonadales bacterium]